LRGANDFLYRARQGQSSTSIKERERRIERPPTAPLVEWGWKERKKGKGQAARRKMNGGGERMNLRDRPVHPLKV